MIEWTNPKPEMRTHFQRFIDAFPGVKTYQVFDDKKTGLPAKILHDAPPEELMRLNKQGYGVFLTINETNGKGRKATDIVRVRAIYVDLDSAPLMPVMDYSPHLVVETSPDRFHAYFLVDEKFELSFFPIMQEALIQKFNSDPVVKDLPRVMRCAGFYHMKREPYKCCVVHENMDIPKLSYEEALEKFPPVKREKWSASKYQKVNESKGEFNGKYGAGAGERNHSCIRIIGGMTKRGLSWSEIENEVWKHAAACNPPMKSSEVEHVLRSGRRYA